MKTRLKKGGRAALSILLSPQARRYEIPLAIAVYEGIRKALGHPQVTAAEKRAALVAAGLDVPKCKCHEVPMVWSRNGNRPSGGGWRCRRKKAAAIRRHYEANRESRLRYDKEYYERNRERIRCDRKAIYEEHADKINQRRRDHYDSDPVFRLGLLLKNNARSRAQTLQRMEARLGTLSHQG